MYEKILARVGRWILQLVLMILPGVAAFITILGIILSMSLKNEVSARYVMDRYPRYRVASQGVEVLGDRKFPAPGSENDALDLGVLEITHPAFPVMLDFIRSEIAVRKSERNEAEGTTASPEDRATEPAALPDINFDRLKTISGAKIPVIRAGPKALIPPYILLVLYPDNVSRRVYEYHSPEEFDLDLRQHFRSELELYALMATLAALLLGTILMLLRWLNRRYHAKKGSPVVASEPNALECASQ